MCETCAVCRKGKGPEKCEVCGFSDNGFINRQFPIPEDAKNWIETVVKPYREQWEAKKREAELLAQLEESRKKEAELKMQLDESKKNVQIHVPISHPQQETFSPTLKEQTSSKFTKSTVILLIVFVSVVIMNYGKVKAYVYFERGNEHYGKKDYDKAMENYNAAIKIKPNDPDYLNNRGTVYSSKKDYDRAIEDYTAALKIKPNDPNYLNNRGDAYYNKKDYDKAIADYEATLRIDPNYYLTKQKLENVRQAQSIESTKNTFTDSRDGKIYKTVKIGNQVWMAENLNYAVKGSKCYGEGGQVWISDKGKDITLSSAEIQANCTKYGRLYNWATVKKACPSGWHLPNKKEWQTLVDIAGGEKIAGKKLKAKSGWNKNGNGMDDFGFAALPGGIGDSGGGFNSVGDYGVWLSAYNLDMGYNRDGVTGGDFNKSVLRSVRCLQD